MHRCMERCLRPVPQWSRDSIIQVARQPECDTACKGPNVLARPLRSQSVPQSLPALRPSPSVSLRLSLSMPQSFRRSVAPSHRPSFPLSLASLRPSVQPVHPHPWPPYLPPSFTVSSSVALNPRSIAAKARQLIPFDHPSLSSTHISLPLFHPLS